MRFDATRLERCYYNHSISKRAAFSFVFIMRTLSYRRARRVQCAAARAAFACIASRAYQPNISCQYLPVCSLQMRHVRNISVLWQAQIRRSSWYSYSLSLCAEPLLFLKKKKNWEGERDREKLQQPVPPYCRWRQALGYCCCFSFKIHYIQDMKYSRAHPMQSMRNAYISNIMWI